MMSMYDIGLIQLNISYIVNLASRRLADPCKSMYNMLKIRALIGFFKRHDTDFSLVWSSLHVYYEPGVTLASHDDGKLETVIVTNKKTDRFCHMLEHFL